MYRAAILVGLLGLPVFARAADEDVAPSVDAAASDSEDADNIAVAEEEATDETVDANAGEDENGGTKSVKPPSSLAKLHTKLKKKDGTDAVVGVLYPFDYTTLDYADYAQTHVLQSLSRYGDFSIRDIKAPISALTLEEFRRVVIKEKIDVLIVTVLKPTNFDIFIYDRRTPYSIYVHSETLAEDDQYRLSNEIVEEYTKVCVRKVLYAYMQDEYFELPRETVTTALGTEIPRWIASARSLALLNREILSRFYASVSVGAALTKGTTGLWNSNLVGIQAGYRLFDELYAEAALDMFSYNAISLGFRYIFQNKDNPFRVSVGLGGAISTNSYTLNWDQNYTQGLGSQYIVPTVAVMLPIVEVHFKVEAKFFIGIDQPRFIVGLMPGLFMLF